MAARPAPRLDVLIDRACRHLTPDEQRALRNGWTELQERLRKAERGVNVLADAHRRAERAEQQLAAVRRVARNYPGLRHLHAALDDGEPADDRDRWDTFDARPGTTDYTRQQQLAAGQPECTECGDTGACNGGPCAHPDAAPSR